MDCSPPGASVHGILLVKHWSGLPYPPPGNLPNPGNKPVSLALQVDSSPLSQGEALSSHTWSKLTLQVHYRLQAPLSSLLVMMN